MTRLVNQVPVESLPQLIDFVVESRIRLEALNAVLEQTNPLMHEFFIGEIEKVRSERGEEFTHTIASELRTVLRGN